MTDTGTTTGEPRNAPTARKRRSLGIALWALQILLAIQFAFAGSLKLIGDPTMVGMFATIGVGQWFRYVVGALEIAGTIGVLIPRFSGLAALGLVCLMVGATITNVFVLGTSPVALLVALLMSALVAWGRWPRTKNLLGRR
jgi:putative oxidoreductase